MPVAAIFYLLYNTSKLLGYKLWYIPKTSLISILVYPINNTIMPIEPLISFIFQLLSNFLSFVKTVKYDKTFVIF